MEIEFSTPEPARSDLLDELLTPTEEKHQASEQDFTPPPSEDFAPPPPPAQDPAPEAAPTETAHDPNFYRNTAATAVKFIENLEKVYFPRFYRMKYFTMDEFMKAEQIKQRVERMKSTDSLNSEELRLFHKIRAYYEWMETLPLFPEERQALNDSLTEIIAQYQRYITPQNTALGTLALILAPRALPLIFGE